MRPIQILLALMVLLAAAPLASAQSGKILKVLPEYMDLKGQTSLSPSLYDRDAYQAVLRRDLKKCSGLAFYVNWKGRHISDLAKLKVKIEIRGVNGDQIERRTLEQALPKPSFFSKWAILKITGAHFKDIGNLIAWRATLWDGDIQLSEQKSFLW